MKTVSETENAIGNAFRTITTTSRTEVGIDNTSKTITKVTVELTGLSIVLTLLAACALVVVIFMWTSKILGMDIGTQRLNLLPLQTDSCASITVPKVNFTVSPSIQIENSTLRSNGNKADCSSTRDPKSNRCDSSHDSNVIHNKCEDRK